MKENKGQKGSGRDWFFTKKNALKKKKTALDLEGENLKQSSSTPIKIEQRKESSSHLKEITLLAPKKTTELPITPSVSPLLNQTKETMIQEEKNKEVPILSKRSQIESKTKQINPSLSFSIEKPFTPVFSSNIQTQPTVPSPASHDSKISETKKEKIIEQETIIPTIPTSKEEQEPELLERQVIYELERLLNDNRFELNQMIMEYHILNQEVDHLYELSDAERMSDEIEVILRRLEQIKKQFEVLEESIHFDNIFQLEDPYFSKLMEQYKQMFTDDLLLHRQAEDFKNSSDYVSIMQKIVEFEQESAKLEQEVVEKKESLGIRDEEFEQLKENYLDLEKIEAEFDILQRKQESMLQEIEEKIRDSVTYTTRVEFQVKATRMLLAETLLILALTKKTPTVAAVGVTAVAAIFFAQQARKMLYPDSPTRTIQTAHYTDYHHTIQNVIKDTHSIASLMDTSLEQIKELQKNFEQDFKPFINQIPEYKEIFENMQAMQKDLENKKDDVRRINENLEVQLHKNDQKVKLLENNEIH